MGTQPLPQIGGACPIFGSRLLWPNGCMDQDVTWYGGRPRPMRHCVRCGPSYPQKKGHTHPTEFLAHVYCGQTAGWMMTPLGTEVDLGPGHIVLDGVPASAKGTQQPLSFPPTSIVATVAHLSYCIAHGRRSLCFTMGCPFPLKISPSYGGIWTPSNAWFPEPTRVLNPNGISIGSAVFAGLTTVTDRHTD